MVHLTGDDARQLCIVRGVHTYVRLPLSRRFIERKDRLDRACWHAGAAVDALVRVDIQHLHVGEPGLILTWMNAVDGAHVDTRRIFGADAGLADDVRQRLTAKYIRMAAACLILTLLGVPGDFTEAPAFVRLFTPYAAAAGTYRAYTTPRGLDAVLAELRREAAPPDGSGSFEPHSVVAADAFGQSGRYNRWKLALLYGARRARVARGPRLAAGRVVEAWTLVSPYPDPELERLNPGTLLIVLRLQP